MTNGTPAQSVKRLDIAHAVAERLGTLPVSQCDQVIELAFNEIGRQLYEGKTVKISGYAIFERVVRPARTARNPRTGETLTVKAKKVLRFRPGTRLSEAAARTRRPERASFERTPAQRRQAARKAAAAKESAAKKREAAAARKRAAEAEEGQPEQTATVKKSAPKKSAPKKSAATKTAKSAS